MFSLTSDQQMTHDLRLMIQGTATQHMVTTSEPQTEAISRQKQADTYQACAQEGSNLCLVVHIKVNVYRRQRAEGDGRGQGPQRGQLS